MYKKYGVNNRKLVASALALIILSVTGAGFTYDTYAEDAKEVNTPAEVGDAEEKPEEISTEVMNTEVINTGSAGSIDINSVGNNSDDGNFVETIEAAGEETDTEIIADEEIEMDNKLSVDIYIDGEPVYMQRDNYDLFAAGPVLFNCKRPEISEKENIIKESIIYEDYSYLVKNNQEDYNPAEKAVKGSIVINPAGEDGECFVYFKLRMYVKIKTEAPAEEAENCTYTYSRMTGEKIYAYIYTSDIYHIIFDTTPPEITELSETDWTSWTKDNRNAEFTADDIRSGIARIVVNCEDEVLYEYHEGQDNSVNFTFPLEKEAQSEDGVKISIYVSDRAGNENSRDYIYYLDRTVPVVKVSGLLNGMIYNCETAPVISASDNIVGITVLEYEIKRMLRNSSERFCSRTVPGITGTEGIFATERLYPDGEYELTARACDKAGNMSETAHYIFRIDRTGPVISMGGFENGAKVNTPITAGIRISEDFYADTSVSIKIVRRWPGGETVFYEENYNPNDYDQSKNIGLNEDGDYVIKVRAEDAAGNESLSEAYLRIDTTAPLISLNGMEEGAITSKHPTINLNVKEMFYDGAGLSAALLSLKEGNIYETVFAESTGISGSEYDYKMEIPGEGRFLLKVIAADEAGNTSESHLSFTVDSTPPVIGWINSLSRKYLKSFLFPRQFAGNITDATGVAYTAYLNAYKIEEGEKVLSDGKYVLRIVAIDEAGNSSEESAEFIVDSSAPRIVVSGMESDGSVKRGEEIAFSLFDVGDYFEYVKMDGKNIETGGDNSVCVVRIDDTAEHCIELKAVDNAGNTTEKTFNISGKAFGSPGVISENINVLKKSGYKEDSVNITKNSDKKYVYIFCALFLGICTIGFPILLGLRHVDTKE